MVSLARPHRRARRAHPRRGGRGTARGGSLSVLAEIVAAADPALAEHAVADPGPGRFEGVVADPDRAFTLEAVYEGYLLHYGAPRVFAGMDADLRLLAGDALFALGLSRVAERGDLEAVAELSDLISAAARAHAEDDPERARALWPESAGRLA
jgi:hypothetical protein